MANHSICVSCNGTGELPSDRGPMDCPDCGGGGYLPSRATLIEWRARDLDKTLSGNHELGVEDARWLLSELRSARGALNEIIALAHDIQDGDAIAMRIRFAANKALGLYEKAEVGAKRTGTSASPS